VNWKALRGKPHTEEPKDTPTSVKTVSVCFICGRVFTNEDKIPTHLCTRTFYARHETCPERAEETATFTIDMGEPK